MSVIRFLPSPYTVLAGLAAQSLISEGTSKLISTRKPINSTTLKILKRLLPRVRTCALWLLVLNWRSWPFIWHIQLFSLVPLLRAQIRMYGIEKTLAIAQDPFDRKVKSKGFVSFDAGDWNGHMSNSSYGKALDGARFKWLIEIFGPSMRNENVFSPLAQTSFTFFKELPMFVEYEIDVHTVSWDDKWIYYVARFTTAPKPKSKSTDRVLHCVALSRSCFKIKGSRLSIPPERVLSLSGCGPNHENWKRATQLRKEKKAKKWLSYGGFLVVQKNGNQATIKGVQIVPEPGWENTGMELYEERRKKGMDVVGRFGNVEGWQEL